MSLQVWLPLNGNLNNNGVANVTITNNGATVNADGKIGSCYYFNGGNQIKITLPSTMTTIKNTSVCAFVKSTSSVLALGGISQDQSNTTACMTLYTSGWQFTGSNAYRYVSGGTIANTSVWHHVCCVMTDTDITTYLDGVQVKNVTIANAGVTNFDLTNSHFIEIGQDSPGSDEKLTGYVNDFRIYDHALSAKEVKEISKALILHMPLDNNGASMPNLAKNPSTYSRKSSNVTFSNNQITIAAQPNQDTYFDIALSEALIENKEYTLSWYVEGLNSSDTAWGFPLFAQANPLSKVIYVKNGYNSITFTCNSTYAGQTVIFMDDLSGRPTTNSTPIIISKIKLEYGNKVTSWCPNAADALYSSLGFNSSTAYDVSGFCNNTTILNLAYSHDTPRYLSSTYFNGNTSQLSRSNTFGNVYNNTYTMSFWIKPESQSGARSIYFGMGDSGLFNVNIEKTTGNVMRYYWGGNPDAIISAVTLPDNEWMHIAIVRSSPTDTKFYKNGVLVYTLTTTCAAHTSHGALIHIGRDARTGATAYKGLMSDFRFYATALSAEDIAELYKVPISIDNTGKVHAIEFNEV